MMINNRELENNRNNALSRELIPCYGRARALGSKIRSGGVVVGGDLAGEALGE
jgi:hypothetical protein